MFSFYHALIITTAACSIFVQSAKVISLDGNIADEFEENEKLSKNEPVPPMRLLLQTFVNKVTQKCVRMVTVLLEHAERVVYLGAFQVSCDVDPPFSVVGGVINVAGVAFISTTKGQEIWAVFRLKDNSCVLKRYADQEWTPITRGEEERLSTQQCKEKLGILFPSEQAIPSKGKSKPLKKMQSIDELQLKARLAEIKILIAQRHGGIYPRSSKEDAQRGQQHQRSLHPQPVTSRVVTKRNKLVYQVDNNDLLPKTKFVSPLRLLPPPTLSSQPASADLLKLKETNSPSPPFPAQALTLSAKPSTPLLQPQPLDNMRPLSTEPMNAVQTEPSSTSFPTHILNPLAKTFKPRTDSPFLFKQPLYLSNPDEKTSQSNTSPSSITPKFKLAPPVKPSPPPTNPKLDIDNSKSQLLDNIIPEKQTLLTDTNPSPTFIAPVKPSPPPNKWAKKKKLTPTPPAEVKPTDQSSTSQAVSLEAQKPLPAIIPPATDTNTNTQGLFSKISSGLVRPMGGTDTSSTKAGFQETTQTAESDGAVLISPSKSKPLTLQDQKSTSVSSGNLQANQPNASPSKSSGPGILGQIAGFFKPKVEPNASQTTEKPQESPQSADSAKPVPPPASEPPKKTWW